MTVILINRLSKDSNWALAADKIKQSALRYIQCLFIACVLHPSTVFANTPAISAVDCGEPALDTSNNRNPVMWQSCDSGDWFFRLTGGNDHTHFAGTIASSTSIREIENLSLEQSGADVLDTSSSNTVSFSLNVVENYEDTFRFSVQAGSSLCVAGEGSLGNQVRVGPDGVLVPAPFDPETLDLCSVSNRPDDQDCGRPSGVGKDLSLPQLWRECGTDHWHMRLEGAGTSTTFSGEILSPNNLASVIDYSLETEDRDVLRRNNDDSIQFSMTAAGPWSDEFVFSQKSSARFCVRTNSSASQTVLVGKRAVPLKPPFDPINMVDGICVVDGGGSGSSSGGSSGSGSSGSGPRSVLTKDNPNPPYNGTEGTWPSSVHVPPEGFPVVENTGVATDASLKIHYGRFDITEDGAVIEGMDINGPINVRASNVTIRNSRVTNGGNAYVVRMYPEFRNLLIEDSRLRGLGACSAVVCCSEFTARRVQVTGCADGIKVGSNSLVEDSLITELYRKDDTASGGTHNDGIQAVGGNNITIRRNTILGPYQMSTSAIILQGNFADLRNILVENNYLSGGSYTTYTRNKKHAMFNVVVQNNLFEHNSWLFGHQSSDPGATWTGNDFHYP